MEILIDGVRYVPASEAFPSSEQIARAIMDGWWGDSYDNKPLSELMEGLYVSVSDDDCGEPIETVLANIAKRISKS